MTTESGVDDGTKYRITACVDIDGVVERTDVVGAVYGQTEGLLGSELDLRTLQRASKASRLDVQIQTDAGRTTGTLTIGSRLDKPETAILAAALETIDQIGPCTGSIEIASIEDVRTAKRREVADRAKELLADGFADGLEASDVIADVKESARRESITTYEGLPAGPRVSTSDSLIVVEGRADVRRMLECGLKNAIAVEGTDVPAAVAALTNERTTTAFVDGDRGGEFVFRELTQVGSIDYLAEAPAGTSVEDLDRSTVVQALRDKVPVDSDPDRDLATEPVGDTGNHNTGADKPADNAGSHNVGTDEPPVGAAPDPENGDRDPGSRPSNASLEDGSSSETDDGGDGAVEPSDTIAAHATAAVRDDIVRLLDADDALVETTPPEDAMDAILEAEQPLSTVVYPGTVEQSLVDVVAERGVSRIIAESTGEFAHQPANVRITLLEDLGTVEA